MTEWRNVSVRDLCTAIVDCINKTAPIVDAVTPYKMIRTTNVRNGWVDTSGVRHVDEETFRRWTRRGRPMRGDVILTREAPLGEVGILRSDEHIFLGQRLVMYRADPARCDARFLAYAMLGPRVQAELRSLGSGATVEHLRVPDCEALTIPTPSVGVQRRIGAVLGSIDDLIANSRRRVDVLETMARLIYREWFVRFRYPGHEGVPLVDSPLGPIPDGWHVEPLFDVAEIGFGFSFKSNRFADRGPFPVVRIRDVPKGTTQTFSDEDPGERYRVVDGDVLVGMDGDFHLRQWSGGVAWLNQRVARLRPRDGLSARHLLFAVDAPIREWNAAISGTTVAHLGKRHLEQVQIVIPEGSVLKRATVILDDLWQQIVALTQAARRLGDMRDLLLPKLVTGQIDVSHLDLNALMEAAQA